MLAPLQLVEQFLADHAVGPQIQLIRNPVCVGALENLYRCIHTCDDQKIVILFDGDDWLAHPRVLQTLNAVYADPHYGWTEGFDTADLQEARAWLEGLA